MGKMNKGGYIEVVGPEKPSTTSSGSSNGGSNSSSGGGGLSPQEILSIADIAIKLKNTLVYIMMTLCVRKYEKMEFLRIRYFINRYLTIESLQWMLPPILLL
jgi:hypothetical protein